MAVSQLARREEVPVALVATEQDRVAALRDESFTKLGKTMLDALERVAFGGMVLDAHGNVLEINASARNLLRQRMGAASTKSDADWLKHAATKLLNRAAPWFPRNTDAWVMISSDTDRPLALHRIPLVTSDGHSEYVVMILADLGAAPQPNPATLRRIFGLTAAEAKLAIQIVQGETPAAIARDHRVSVATIRSQLASIFGKTQTRRQSELAMLLTRAAILP